MSRDLERPAGIVAQVPVPEAGCADGAFGGLDPESRPLPAAAAACSAPRAAAESPPSQGESICNLGVL